MRRAWLGGIVAVHLLAASPSAGQEGEPSAADVAQARELFRQGVQSLRAQRWQEACDLLERSNAIVETAPTRMNLSICSDSLGRILDQSEHLRAYLRLSEGDDDAQRRAASQAIERIADRIPRLVVTMPDFASGSELRIDSELVPEPTWGSPRPVNPGAIAISVRGPDVVAHDQTVEVPEGETIEVELWLTARMPTPGEAASTSTDEAPREREPISEAGARDGVATRWWFWTLVGAAALGLGLGLYFGLRGDAEFRDPQFPDTTLTFEALTEGG